MQRYDALVLGGGGVKSIAYLGAIEELEAYGFCWDTLSRSFRTVAGSSAGSFGAACVGLDLSKEHMDMMMRKLDSSYLIKPGLLDMLITGLDTVFSFPSFGMIPFERLVALYENLVVDMGLEKDATLASYWRKTSKYLDIYVTNLSTKTLECWSHKNHPTMSLAFALAVSSAIPFVITSPVIAGCMYGDGGIMSNVPICAKYDSSKTLVMMIDIEPHGNTMPSMPSWFGHHLSRIMDAVYEGHRASHMTYDPMWYLYIVRLHSEAVTLMDTFGQERVPEAKLDAGKREGARSMRLWLAERFVLLALVAKGVVDSMAGGKPGQNKCKETIIA